MSTSKHIRHNRTHRQLNSMGYADEFYTVIRSADSTMYFPSNTPSDFYVRLPHTLELHGDWCVGVNEVWVSKQWYNVSGAYIEVCLSGDEYEKWGVSTGYYTDNKQLVDELNSVVGDGSDGSVAFTYGVVNHRLYISTKPGVKVKLSPNLCEIVGHTIDTEISGSWASTTVMDVNKKDSIIYIHCDVISGQLFSDNILPVVKVLDTSYGDFGSVVHDNILSTYANVDKKTFDIIHIELRTSPGDLIKFEGGQTIIQLHFRRR
jgi:hypothetical protein